MHSEGVPVQLNTLDRIVVTSCLDQAGKINSNLTYSCPRDRRLAESQGFKKAFRHVKTLFVQGNIFVLNQNKPPCLVIKEEVNYC